MEKPLLENLLTRQRKLTALKEELSKDSSWIIASKLSYSLAQTLFFNKNLCYKQPIDEKLNKNIRRGFWCKQPIEDKFPVEKGR